jgi:hypothetical protein
MRNAYKTLIRNAEGKRSLGGRPVSWLVNAGMDLKEV